MSSQIEKWKEREEKRKKLAEERKKYREEQIKKSQEQAESQVQAEDPLQEEPKNKEQQEKRPKEQKKHKKPKQEKKERENPKSEQPDEEQTKQKEAEETKKQEEKHQTAKKKRRRPQPKKTENKNNEPKGVKKMAETTNWNDELKNDETYKLAEKLGIDMTSFTADSEDAKKAQLEEIKKQIKELETAGNPPNGGKKNDESQRGTLEVNGEDKETPTPVNGDWIKQKREFYEKFAHDQNLELKNDPAKDNEEKSFTFSLEKDGKSLGEMKYINPNSVQISKDSEIQMYQGLVKDALENDLALSFGKSLDEKQQAMLLAAVLMSEKKTYANGDGIELKNPPQIDVNAEYFKTLPQDVQTVLKDHVAKQAQQDVLNKEAEEKARKEQEAKAKQEALQKKLQSMRAKVEQRAQALGKETKELTGDEYRDAYREALHEGLTDEQKQARQEKLNDREKILAARLGLIPEHTTKDKDGKPVTITKDQKTADLIQQVNPKRFQELQDKYSGRN